MNDTQQHIDVFFDQYARRTNDALGEAHKIDVDSSTKAFADYFVEANPKGVICAKNDEEFRKSIPKGLGFYRSLGTKSMNIINKIITPLDDYHWMVKVHWQATYLKKDGSKDVIDFDVIYFVQVLKDEPKIFAYITGDEEQTYKDHDLVPN